MAVHVSSISVVNKLWYEDPEFESQHRPVIFLFSKRSVMALGSIQWSVVSGILLRPVRKYRGGQKWVYRCEYAKHRVYSCITVYLFIIELFICIICLPSRWSHWNFPLT
jgi:hypothetical protein